MDLEDFFFFLVKPKEEKHCKHYYDLRELGKKGHLPSDWRWHKPERGKNRLLTQAST